MNLPGAPFRSAEISVFPSKVDLPLAKTQPRKNIITEVSNLCLFKG